MALVKDKIFILKSTDYSEADKILTVYGENFGKYGIIAKGIRKIKSKNRGNVQTLSISQISFYQGQNLGVLTESEELHTPALSVDKFEIYEKLLFLIHRTLPDQEPDPFVFTLIESFLRGEITLRNFNIFRSKYLIHLGYIPDFRFCFECGQKVGQEGKVDLDNINTYCRECESNATNPTEIKNVRFESQVYQRALETLIANVVNS